MNKQLLDRFLKRNVVVSVKTQQEWNELMELLENEIDAMWANGKKPTEVNHWVDSKERTTVSFWYYSRVLGYGDIDYHISEGLEVVDFQELKGETNMNTAEKLRFLADRAEDGEEFKINNLRYRFNNGELEVKYSWWMSSQLLFNAATSSSATLALTPNWTFSEDEKVILRNLGEKWDYIARDEGGSLFIYMKKPEKQTRGFYELSYRPFQHFNHLFQSIQWSDEEACEFREYL